MQILFLGVYNIKVTDNRKNIRMQVQKISNNNMSTSFRAGQISLERVSTNALNKYEAIRKIAEEGELDLFVRRVVDSKYLSDYDVYTVEARQNMGVYPFSASGTGVMVIEKQSKAKEISKTVYKTIINAVKGLGMDIYEHTGKKPEFLQYLKM